MAQKIGKLLLTFEQTSTQPSSSALSLTQCSPMRRELLTSFRSDPTRMATAYNTDVAIKATGTPLRALLSVDSPTVHELREVSDRGFYLIVAAHLTAFAQSANDNSPESVAEQAKSFIAAIEPKTKMSELLLFFGLLRTGRIEFHVYGSINYHQLCQAWHRWYNSGRHKIVHEEQLKQQQREAAETRKKWAEESTPCPPEILKEWGLEHLQKEK